MIDLATASFGSCALGFAVLVIVLRQPMRAALALIAHMICLAGIFACLGVHVVALFQVLIYVGAVMVLMIYTIMLLDDRDASYVKVFSRWSVPAIAAGVLLVFSLGWLLRIPAQQASSAAADPPFGFADFSLQFMSRYWFHFELATVLLLVGIVAVWAVISEQRRES
jgi:NADH-quinone oxidoreductase subunit J